MPVYEYKCTVCERRFDVEQSFTDDPLTTLAGCELDRSGDHQLKKVFSSVGISFKGDGFYRNDARQKASSSSTGSTGTTSESDTSSAAADGGKDGSGSSEKSNGSSNGSGNGSSDKSSGSSTGSSTKSASSTSD